MALSSCAAVDNTFGPHAKDCRGGFDLTLLFEESILSVPAIALLLIAVPCRIVYLLHKGTVKVEKNFLLYCKAVSETPDNLFYCFSMAVIPFASQPLSNRYSRYPSSF